MTARETFLETDLGGGIHPTDYIQFNKDGSGAQYETGLDLTFTFTYTATATNLDLVYKNSGVETIDNPIQDLAIIHLDTHTLFVIQPGSETVNNVT